MTIRAFQDYELKRMSEQNFKAVGWDRYKDSPYKEYKKTMEKLGYEQKKFRTRDSEQDSRT